MCVSGGDCKDTVEVKGTKKEGKMELAAEVKAVEKGELSGYGRSDKDEMKEEGEKVSQEAEEQPDEGSEEKGCKPREQDGGGVRENTATTDKSDTEDAATAAEREKEEKALQYARLVSGAAIDKEMEDKYESSLRRRAFYNRVKGRLAQLWSHVPSCLCSSGTYLTPPSAGTSGGAGGWAAACGKAVYSGGSWKWSWVYRST